jgi:replication factor A1
VKVEELTPNSREVEVTVTVVEKKDQRDVTTRDGSPHQVAEFIVGDESGCILLSLWDDAISKAEIGKTYTIKNGYVNVFRNSMRLNVGRQGTMEASESAVEANASNNLSDKHVENPRRFRGGFGRGRRF